MEPEFWHQRWQENLIGFHQSEINPHMREFWSRLDVTEGSRVFVPLCGKSLDMLWLRDQGYDVIGVELSNKAVEAFFAENSLQVNRQEQGAFTLYQSRGITIYCGDIFDLESSHLQGVTAVFDRASLIALPSAMRQQYADHLISLLEARQPVLLITLEYKQADMQGPPFAVLLPEIELLYGKYFSIEYVEDIDVLAEQPKFAERGLTSLHEKVYVLR